MLRIAPQYYTPRIAFNWRDTDTDYVVHIAPRLMDDFGNQVKAHLKHIRWHYQQTHDCPTFARPVRG